ncbi:IS3 family transposase [Lysinibacillus sphaericus]
MYTQSRDNAKVLISYEELKKKIERYIDYYNNERIKIKWLACVQ